MGEERGGGGGVTAGGPRHVHPQGERISQLGQRRAQEGWLTMKGLALCLGAALVLATSIVSHADDSTDLAVAGSWLTAAARDNAALESATAFPFTFRTTNKI